MKKRRPNRALRFWIPVLASVVATPICLCLGVASAGAGHGSYFAATILFPYTMLSAFPITPPFILLAVVQFPIYGIILGFANIRGKVILILVAFVLLAVHGLAIGSIYARYYHALNRPERKLDEAVQNGDVETAKRLLDSGIDPNSQPCNRNLLSLACYDGHVEIAKLLLEKGADINYQSKSRVCPTALFSAVLRGDEPIVQLLLSKGADVTIKDSFGHTVLDCARLWREDRLKRSERNHEVYTASDRARDERIISLLESATKNQKKP